MAALIAPGVARYTVNGSYAGRPVANILDVFIDTTGSVEQRATAVFSQAGIIINEWSDHVLPLLADNYRAESVSWVDLDSINGTTGERSSTSQETWPQNGGNPANAMPGNVAYRVTKQVIAERGQRQGRLYLAGVIETATDDATPNTLKNAIVNDINNNFQSFVGNVNQSEEGPVGYTSALCVVHTVNGVYSARSDIEAMVADNTLATQRRRLRG